MLADLMIRLRSLLRRRNVESELEDELRFHSERQLEKYLKSGMDREEAMRRVRLEFGGMEQVKEDCRDARGVMLLETLAQDLRYGWRTLGKSPGFAVTALITIALGIGANAALFSVIYGVLLSPLPFKDASRLLQIKETTPKVGDVSVSYPNFQDWHAQSRTFSGMTPVVKTDFNLAGITQPEHINGLAVSPDFFSMTGVEPVIGRRFTPDEAKAGTAPVLLLSYGLWQSHFGGSRDVVGKVIRLDGTEFTIVGVLPATFRWTEKCDVMEPLGVWLTNNESAKDRGDRGEMAVVGRMAPEATFEQARAEMARIAANLAREYPGPNGQFGVHLQPLRNVFSGEDRPAMIVLQIAAFFVLLVACANVANLFLMRGTARTREIALRSAIGASTARIVRQILTESFLVALLGGLAGLGLAFAGIPLIVRSIPEGMLGGARVGLSGAVLLFSAGLILLSVLAFGLGPAMQFVSADLQTELKEGVKGTASGHRMRWRTWLAAGELALALILLVGAGLMIRSLYRLLSVDSGFQAAQVVKFEMNLRTAQHKTDPQLVAFWRKLLDGVRAVPGIESASLGTGVPLTGDHSRTDIQVEGRPAAKPGSNPHPDVHIVSPSYEKTLGVQLLRGRGFTDDDRENGLAVAMVNGLVAKGLFPGEDPVGKRFTFGDVEPGKPTKWMTIVGVLADTKMYGLANPARLEVYVPFSQNPQDGMTLLVKSAEDPHSLVTAVRNVVAGIDKQQPLFGIATMREVVNASISTRRITLILLGLFSGLALVLAAIGIYGVISYSVAQREKEIGIRVALGAKRGDVLGLVLGQGVKIVGTGIVCGTLASVVLTRLMRGLLYSVSAFDPITFGAVVLGLVVVAFAACYIPARRMLRLDPLVALRQE